MNKPILLGNDPETGEEVYFRDSNRRYGTFLFGKSGTGASDTLLRLILSDIEAGRGLFFLDSDAQLIPELLARIGRPFQDKVLLFDPTHETHTFCLNPLRCPARADPQQRAEASARTYSILKHLLSANLSDTQPFLKGMAKTPKLKLILKNIIPVFLENQEYSLSELPLFLENRQFREYLVSNVRYDPQAVRFWREQFSRSEALLIAARVTHLFTNPIVAQVLGNTETTIDMLSHFSEGKIILVSFSKDINPEHKACISCLLFSELLRASNKWLFHNFPFYVSELLELPDLKDFLVLFPEAQRRGIKMTFSASELGEEFLHVYPMHNSNTPATYIFFQLREKDAWELAPELIEGEEWFTRTPIDHIWEHGFPLEYITEYRERYFWPVDSLQKFPEAHYFPFDPAVYQNIPTDSPFPPDFAAFSPWVCYRSSADMLREGIALLNDYYDKAMLGRIDLLCPPSEEQLDRFVRVLDCFAGFFGYYPTLTPVLADGLPDTYPERIKLSLIMLRTHTQLSETPLGQFLAWQINITPSQFVEFEELGLIPAWRPHALLPQRGKILREVIRTRLLELLSQIQKTKTVFALDDSERAGQLPTDFFLPKDIVFPREKELAETAMQIVSWQQAQVGSFIDSLFFFCPRFLSEIPLRANFRMFSNEATKKEYQERRAAVARKLSNLSPSTAYLITNQLMEGYFEKYLRQPIRQWRKIGRKFCALPRPQEEDTDSDIGRRRAHISQLSVFLKTLPYLYPRDLLEAQIRKRQEPWQSSPTLPPAPVRLL